MEFNKVQSMLLGVAMGDAYGAPYEFAFKDRYEYGHGLDFSQYRSHPTRKQGMYTDDTQMSIAVAELLSGDLPFTHENLADAFVMCYKRDPIEGYSKRVKAALEASSSGKEFLQNIDKNATGNGAAMRALPLGVIKDLSTLIQYAKINAEVSHNTPQGIASSVAVALLAHNFLYGDGNKSMFDFVLPHIEKIDKESYEHFKAIQHLPREDPEIIFGKEFSASGLSGDAMHSVGAVMYILSTHADPKVVLRKAIHLGGDTDSTAAMSLGLNLAKYEVRLLPDFLLKGLTNHEFGRDYIIKLGDKLAKKLGV